MNDAESDLEDEPTFDDRTRVAYHEAAHAAIAYLLGHTPSVVSITPALRWRGVCYSDAPPIDQAALAGLRTSEAPLVLQPIEVRANLERRILVALAGPAGDQLYLYRLRFGGYVRADEDDRAFATEAVRQLALTAEERARLARGDDPDIEPSNDEADAHRLAEALVAEEEVTIYLAWLSTSAQRLVWSPGHIRMIETLVAALLEHGQLSGEAVTTLLEQARRRLAA